MTFQRFGLRIQLFLRLEMGAAEAVGESKTLSVRFGTVKIASALTVQIAERPTLSAVVVRLSAQLPAFLKFQPAGL